MESNKGAGILSLIMIIVTLTFLNWIRLHRIEDNIKTVLQKMEGKENAIHSSEP